SNLPSDQLGDCLSVRGLPSMPSTSTPPHCLWCSRAGSGVNAAVRQLKRTDHSSASSVDCPPSNNGTAIAVTAIPMSAATRVRGSLREVGLHDLLLDAEHSGRLRVHADLQPVNLGFAVGLHSRKQQVGKRLVDEEEMIVAVREHHMLGVLLRQSLEVVE